MDEVKQSRTANKRSDRRLQARPSSSVAPRPAWLDEAEIEAHQWTLQKAATNKKRAASVLVESRLFRPLQGTIQEPRFWEFAARLVVNGGRSQNRGAPALRRQWLLWPLFAGNAPVGLPLQELAGSLRYQKISISGHPNYSSRRVLAYTSLISFVLMQPDLPDSQMQMLHALLTLNHLCRFPASGISLSIVGNGIHFSAIARKTSISFTRNNRLRDGKPRIPHRGATFEKDGFLRKT